MSESFEQIDSVRVFFKDGSCAFLKNHSLNVNAVITQLTEERAALAAENERLRAELDFLKKATRLETWDGETWVARYEILRYDRRVDDK